MARLADERSKSIAVRAAGEAFAYAMCRGRVRRHEHAVEAWIHAAGRPVAGGTSREVVRRIRLAPPFWPLTVCTDEPLLTGYGVNAHASVIRYAQRNLALSEPTDGFTSVRTEFGPGCRELLGRASAAWPVFICELLPPSETRDVMRTYLVDALL